MKPNPYRYRLGNPTRLALLIAVLAPLSGYTLAQFSPPPPRPAAEQPEVLTRGPIHEAFAEPVNLQAQAGLTVPVQPPANVEELPSADRPRGDFAWIPGYWSWDSDRNGFIWVSACWRAAPPNHYWVPGYWAAVVEAPQPARGGLDVNVGGLDIQLGRGRPASPKVVGWEWVAGFWAPLVAQQAPEIEYLSAPPAPVDLEPVGAPPAADVTWIPGCWYWQNNQYVRRAGYWLRQDPDWVWEPSHYVWTPRGYVFVEGYWDYALDRRGVLFAPVYLPAVTYAQPGYVYSPTIVIDVEVLRLDLFVYSGYSHYYFGDYYDDGYQRMGIVSRYQVQRTRTYYDPIYTQDRWRNSQRDARWETNQRAEYDRRHADKALRPARTYRELETRVAALPEPQRRSIEVAAPVATIAARKTTPIKFEQLKAEDRQNIAKKSADTRKLRDERVKWEAAPAPVDKSPKPAETPAAPTDRRDRVTPPVDRAPTPVKPAEIPAVPTDRRDRVTPPVDRTPKPVKPAETPAPPVDRTPKTVKPPEAVAPPVSPTPRETPTPQPERVRVPVTPPAATPPSTPSDTGKAPPPRPNEEQSHKPKDAPKADPKDTPKADPKDSPKNVAKEAPKPDPKDAPNADPKDTPKDPKEKDKDKPGK